jgi:lipopolysaccharide export system permease protein
LKLLALTLTLSLFIFLIIEFVQKLDNFLEAEASTEVIFAYLLYKIPFVVVQITPVATLISIIVMFCLLRKNNEITAMKACGLNVIELSRPIIIASLVIAIGVFLISELIVPFTSSRSNRIWSTEVKKKDPARFYGRNHVLYRGKDSFYVIRNFDSKKNILQDPAFYFFDESFRVIKRIDGQKGIWTGKNWKIEKGMSQEIRDSGGYRLKKFDEIYLNIPESPETFVRPVRKPEEMSYWQLKRYAKRVREEGYDATEYLVDMNIKMAFPLINLVVVFFGIPIALGLRKGGTPLAVTLGVGVCFLYLTGLGFSRSLGLSGLLPPLMSAWAANLVFFFIGTYLMIRVEM